MKDMIGVLNAGSSSIKFSLFVLEDNNINLLARGQIEGLYTAPRFLAKDKSGKVLSEKSWPDGTKLGHEGGIDHLFTYVRAEFRDHNLLGVGHRVVQGGLEYPQPVRVTPDVLAKLERLIPMFPLHQPHNLAPIKLLMERRPELPQVACFDSSFHRTNPRIAQLFAIPLKYADEGIIRYGFHGLSYEYISSVLPKFDARAASGKTVVLHLGNGASMCAFENGKSMTCTLEFSGVGGLPMGTRSGSLDPGLMLYFMRGLGMDAQSIEKLVYNQSGLLGVSGISSDMRTLLESREPKARLAIDLFLYRIRRELGSLTAALGGLDSIIFTGGIGENAPPIREGVCRDAAWLGVELDTEANKRGGPRISAETAKVSAWVIPTNEEFMIASHTKRLIGQEVAV